MKKYIPIILIFILALVLRFYRLGTFRCLNWDEAAFGYNAYSILLTGKDEYGVRLPLQFKSVGDYKAPLYVYLTVPVIKVLGLNEFSVRFMPALLGSLSIVIFYLITKELFKNEKLSLISSLFLAISPWHIQFTKAGADVGIATFFTILGIYGFIKGAKGTKFGYVLAALGFAGSIYSYFAERLFIPLISVFLFFYYRGEIIKTKRNFIIGIMAGLIMIAPIIPSLISTGHQEKILKTTIFGYQRSEDYLYRINKEDNSKILYLLYHTSLFENGWGIINRYVNHFSPSFLFLQGVTNDPRQFISNMGVLYLFDLPLILIGLYALLKSKNKVKYLILGWLLVAPIPAAITKDPISARRSFNMVYPFLILSALGLLEVWRWLKKLSKPMEYILMLIFSGVLVYFVCFYLASYYIFTPPKAYAGPAGWQCGYKELVSYMQGIKKQNKQIIVDTSYQGPYLFFLFYEKYNPADYQKQARLVQDSPGSLGEGVGYDNYTFRPIYWPRDRCLLGKIFVGPPERLPSKDLKKGEVELLGSIYFPDGKEAFRIVKTITGPKGYCEKILSGK